jgi:methylthioribulose-1-phosphate dehydratase
LSDYQEKIHELIAAGHFLFERNWVPATSGNISVRLDDAFVGITVSGKHKGRLQDEDIMRVDLQGVPVASGKKPSAETLLHTTLYQRFPDVLSVLHTHSVNATLLSRRYGQEVMLEDFELLKAFKGIDTHESRVVIPVFDNDQDIRRLSGRVNEWLDQHEDTAGYLIRGHGLYTWGDSIGDALRHVEAFEFLFECRLKELSLGAL